MDWRKNMPQSVPEGISDKVQQIMWSELERMIMKVCQVNKLTDPQRDILDRDVDIIGRDMETSSFPSPNDLFDHSALYRAFATDKCLAMANAGATAGKIVNALANYIHPHGWLAYVEKNKPIETIDKTERSGKTVAEAFDSGN